mmetsp:Transcript_9747/g.30241  ORF Transcript_9747/g.30241 Transcript_9747/m.30241 type:complete len:222 (-) Transcript_9747:329-994(-)
MRNWPSRGSSPRRSLNNWRRSRRSFGDCRGPSTSPALAACRCALQAPTTTAPRRNAAASSPSPPSTPRPSPPGAPGAPRRPRPLAAPRAASGRRCESCQRSRLVGTCLRRGRELEASMRSNLWPLWTQSRRCLGAASSRSLRCSREPRLRRAWSGRRTSVAAASPRCPPSQCNARSAPGCWLEGRVRRAACTTSYHTKCICIQMANQIAVQRCACAFACTH